MFNILWNSTDTCPGTLPLYM